MKLSRAAHCKLADEVLKELITEHFFSKDLAWSYIENVNLLELNLELYKKIVQLYPELVESKIYD